MAGRRGFRQSLALVVHRSPNPHYTVAAAATEAATAGLNSEYGLDGTSSGGGIITTGAVAVAVAVAMAVAVAVAVAAAVAAAVAVAVEVAVAVAAVVSGGCGGGGGGSGSGSSGCGGGGSASGGTRVCSGETHCIDHGPESVSAGC